MMDNARQLGLPAGFTGLERSARAAAERRGNWEEKGKFREGENRKGGPYIMDRWKNILKKESGGR